MLSCPNDFVVQGFADVDWASDPNDCKSTSGHCIFFGGDLITWGSKKQNIISRSSTEVEFHCIANAAIEILWIQSLLHELCTSSSLPILWCDNMGVVHLSANLVLHSRTKHVELNIYFVRDLVLQQKIVVHHLPEFERRLAHICTKPLSSTSFSKI